MTQADPASDARSKQLAAHWRAMTPTRMYDYGMLPDDVERMQQLTDDGAAWDVAAESLADSQQLRAEQAVAAGHRLTAIEAYRAAAADLIFAQMAFNFDTPANESSTTGSARY